MLLRLVPQPSNFLLTDQVGTLRAVANTSGNIVKRIDYDSFGNIIADSNPGFSVPFGFAGGLHDRDTGLVRFGYRDYSPELGRFVAKDPIDFAGGDTNLYAYVTNDPVNFVDPSGLRCTYSQSSGRMTCVDDNGRQYYDETGYSGTGAGRNNPDQQGVPNTGPVPRGSWEWGTPRDSPNTGRNTVPLDPLPGNECFGTERDCSSFRAHGNNARNDASQGCIVLPPNRTQIPPGEIVDVVR